MSGTRKSAIVFLGIVVGVILAVTLFPYDFYFDQPFKDASHLATIKSVFDLVRDLIQNFILFIPFGFGLAWLLKTVRNRRRLVWAALLGFGLSFSLEWLQLYLPTRVVTWRDVAANGLGSLAGAWLFDAAGAALLRIASERKERMSRLLTRRRLGLALGLWVLLGLVVQSQMRGAGSLQTWCDDDPLLLGNERTGDRPWRGEIDWVTIFDRALSDDEIEMLWQGQWPPSPLCHLRLDECGRVIDQEARLPELHWMGAGTAPEDSPTIRLDEDHWLSSVEPARALIARLKTANAFTISIRLRSLNLSADGPARILSISRDPFHRNLTLGQSQSDLIFRLNTPVTGENGTSPEFLARNIFRDREARHLILSYDGRLLELFVDGEKYPHTLPLSAGARFYKMFTEPDFFEMRGYEALYAAGLYGPILLFTYGILSKRRHTT